MRNRNEIEAREKDFEHHRKEKEKEIEIEKSLKGVPPRRAEIDSFKQNVTRKS